MKQLQLAWKQSFAFLSPMRQGTGKCKSSLIKYPQTIVQEYSTKLLEEVTLFIYRQYYPYEHTSLLTDQTNNQVCLQGMEIETGLNSTVKDIGGFEVVWIGRKKG